MASFSCIPNVRCPWSTNFYRIKGRGAIIFEWQNVLQQIIYRWIANLTDNRILNIGKNFDFVILWAIFGKFRLFLKCWENFKLLEYGQVMYHFKATDPEISNILFVMSNNRLCKKFLVSIFSWNFKILWDLSNIVCSIISPICSAYIVIRSYYPNMAVFLRYNIFWTRPSLDSWFFCLFQLCHEVFTRNI